MMGEWGKIGGGVGKTLLCAGCRRKDDQGNNFPKNQFTAWRAGTTTLFLLGS
jgi:hypothetical protein